MLDKRLNDKGKNWRHVLKSLKVLDYILHEGSELVITWSKKNIYIVKTLREFVYLDDEGRDVGANVRQSAKDLTALINDDDRLRAERRDRKSWKSRVTGLDDVGPGMGSDPDVARARQARRHRRSSAGGDENDLEYKLALEASKNQAEEDAKRRSTDPNGATDDDLAKAIKLSKEEEELRKRELEQSNANSLFDDTPAQNQPQFTGYNQGYQQQGAVDWYGNPIDAQQQQSQTTGYLNNMYSQPTGFQNQATGFQNGFGQPQQTGYDQFGQQQQQFLQPQQTVQPQQTAFNNPYQQQQDFNQFQQQQQVGSPSATGSNNPFGGQQSQPQADTLQPMKTGSNNPFAARPVQQQPPMPSRNQPSLNSIAEQRTANPIANFSSPMPQQQYQPQQQQIQPQATQSFAAQQRTELDPHRARLNAMLASGDGMDTFGNTGDMRIPAQHTAPGAFVNSAGQNLDRLRAERTGNNPFMLQQQATGVPQHFNAPQQAYGGGNNPFGQRQQQPGGNSLIDL